MKITKVEVSDFRAFPGPSIYTFDFKGRQNLLLYGENGSGKSSLFRALVEFFRLDSSGKPFAAHKNIFSDPALIDGKVTVHFDSGVPALWTFEGERPTTDPRVAETAIRKGCLDYKALLQTNFIHTSETVNLFDLAINSLLAAYPVTISGGKTVALGKLWEQVLAAKPKTHHKSNVHRVNDAIVIFNDASKPVFPLLEAKVKELLQIFPACPFELTLDFPGVGYDTTIGVFTGREILLGIKFQNKAIPSHHHLLNEARLSAIALALYLAGLLISIPAPVPGGPTYPKLLVLDDVLIGIDMSNRMPVLEILAKYFSDWQIVLITHDKVWYEMARLQTSGGAHWTYHELYAEPGGNCLDRPVQHGNDEGWTDYLARARKHLQEHDERAAATYARAAFESKIKRYCDKQGIAVRYRIDQRMMLAESFWEAIKKKIAAEGKTAEFQVVFTDIETYRKVVLNPLSHSGAAAISRVEIENAIRAVEALKALKEKE